MRSLLALFAVGLLSVCLAACGGTSKGAGSASHASSNAAATGSTPLTTSSTTPPGSYFKNDGDKDGDDEDRGGKSADNDDRALLAAYGNEAGQADKRAVTTVVKGYYAAAAAGDGAKACSLLATSLAMGLAEGQSQSVQSGGKTCAAAVSLLFKQQHQQLAADDVATMVVTGMHVKGNLGLAVLGFKTMPEGEILVEREDRAWKIDALFDSDMT
jgi:hypothetical protein